MPATTDEHEPLISASADHQTATYTVHHSPEIEFHGLRPSRDSSPPSPVRAPSPSIRLAGGAGRGYGALATTTGTAPAQYSYTWSDMNVFTAEPPTARRSRVLAMLRRQDKGQQPPRRKQILKSVHGEARPGELLAIMGSSGAGKTTLLNTLLFRSARGLAVSGTRALNGRPVNSTDMAALSAYVQQDDMFIGTLTVKEHLIFQALVRMDKHIPYHQRMKRVEEVISELALGKCQHTVIGIPGRLKGISGGEMKRLSFASEVLTNPPLMFCDEPTSGLDSFMAQNVIQVLKGLAQKGKTVVSTIHQPSSEVFAMFDKLLLMAEGRVAFLGTPDQATHFFRELGAACPENYNPADFYIQVLAVVPSKEEASKQTIETVCDAFQKTEVGSNLALKAEAILANQRKMDCDLDDWGAPASRRSPYKASWCAQFRAVLWRSWLSVIKEPMLIKVRVLQTVMVALLIGVIYFGQKIDQDGVMNINGAIFIFLTNMTFQNVFSVINVFCSELTIFLREHRSGMYRTDVYFLCKTLAEAPIYAAIPFLFTSIAYFMIGMNPEPQRFFTAAAITVLVANVATSFGYLISCASRSVSMALSIGPPVVIPFMLFGGFFLNSGSVPAYLEWLSLLSWFRYGNEALLINQWEGVDTIACTRANSTCPRSGLVVLQTLNFSEDNFAVDITCLVALIVGFRFLAYIALLSRTFRTE